MSRGMSDAIRALYRDAAAPGQRASGGPSIGDQIASYRLVRLLGASASSQVFEVENVTTGQHAAMKVFAPGRAEVFGGLGRLSAEAQALAEIDNPHFVAVTDFVEADGPGG